MAIHPSLRSEEPSQGSLSPHQARAISAWTEQATASLENLTLSESVPAGNHETQPQPPTSRSPLRGATVSLSIPLDDPLPTSENQSAPKAKLFGHTSQETQKPPTVSFRRRQPLRRDSLKRRDALLKGKDGSRRRQRWENDRLLHNPWAEPPSSKDWEIQPNYPRHNPMPYILAPLWEYKYKKIVDVDHNLSKQTPKGTWHERNHIPKELRSKLKHARAARGMLQDLEEDIRQFIQRWNDKQLSLQKEGLADAPEQSGEESEDEVVFVGRNGQQTHDSPAHKDRLQHIRETMSAHNERDGEKMVLESLTDDRTAGFGRWLVHSIASYYGLHTWSVTVGEPARREAYVGFYPPAPGSRPGLSSQSAMPKGCHQKMAIRPGDELPRPLWAQV